MDNGGRSTAAAPDFRPDLARKPRWRVGFRAGSASSGIKGKASETDGFSQTRLREARAVVNFNRDLAYSVRDGIIGLDDALKQGRGPGRLQRAGEPALSRDAARRARVIQPPHRLWPTEAMRWQAVALGSQPRRACLSQRRKPLFIGPNFAIEFVFLTALW